jgi:hypothetical protein
MSTSWRASMTASAAALALLAGIAAAKVHGDHGPGGPGNGHGNGHATGWHGPHDGQSHGVHGHGAPGSGDCATASSAIGAFVDATCPCAGRDDGAGGTRAWKNHGQYVRCVAHAVRNAARSLGVKRRCGRGLVPCAARSTCGKDHAVACFIDGECSVLRADECAALGGSGESGSCCTASPSGAFVD